MQRVTEAVRLRLDAVRQQEAKHRPIARDMMSGEWRQDVQMWPDRRSERLGVQLFAAIFAEIGVVIHRTVSALWPDRDPRSLGCGTTRWDPRPWDPRFARWDPRHII